MKYELVKEMHKRKSRGMFEGMRELRASRMS